MTLGSLFNGISGWILAGKKYGIETLWESEVDKFCEAVTKHHFPEVSQLGDITKLHGAELPPVDIICAGSPCQNLSVAGNQEGLKGEQSRLFMDAIRIVRGMRAATGGKSPRFFVWENVPGAFSSNKGLDFRAVLEEIGQTSIPMPEGGKWANAGLAELPECEIAWRVLDAQHHVPQRRKRIFLVADFGAERRCAAEILLIEPSVPRDSSESGEAGEGFAAGAESGIGGAIVAAGFKAGNGAGAGTIGYEIEKAATLTSAESGTNRPTVAVYDMTHADEVMRPVEGGKCQTLNARMGTGGNQVPVLVFREGSFGQYEKTDIAGTTKAVGGALGGGSETFISQKSVRRLTPTECERLQGLPDGYTLIDDKTCSDTARYKALGNGMCQNCADYVIRRIREATT